MTEQIPQRNETARMAMLEQSYVYFGQQQAAMGQKLDRLYAYIFGGDQDDDSMRSQVRAMSKQIDALTHAFQDSQKENQTARVQGFQYVDQIEKRVAAIERWQSAMEGVTMDKKTLTRQYAFMIISALTSSTIGVAVGWFLGRILH